MVQGVGFRWFTRNAAGLYGLGGWVRNRPDGSVEIEAEGQKEAVEAFLADVREGPRFSRVSAMSVDWIAVKHEGSFEVTG